MRRKLIPLLVCLLAATAASAQPGGGGGRGRGGGGGGSGPQAPKKAPTAMNQIQFTGVVKAVDTATGRVTISYDAVEPINWPSGTQPFPVAKSALLDGVTVGEKVHFTIDSGEISSLKPF